MRKRLKDLGDHTSSLDRVMEVLIIATLLMMLVRMVL